MKTDNKLTTIPNFSQYSITKDGKVYKTRTFKEMAQTDGYGYYILHCDDGTKKTVTRQYLLNKTFPKKNLLEGFVPIKNHDRYLISQFGEIWDTLKLRFLKYNMNKRKPVVRLTDNLNNPNNVNLRQLLRYHFPESLLLVFYPDDAENFTDIPDFPDYMVSKDGRVWSKKKGKFKSVNMLQTGYLATTLSNGQYKNNVLLHRILATTFIPNPDNLPVVQHLNDNKLDNNLSNLSWSTQKDNIQNAAKNGRMNNAGNRLTDQQQIEIAQRFQDGELRKDLAEIYGVSVVTIDRYKNN